MDYLLAHDVGTSGDKAALITPDGQILATAYEPYPIHFPRQNWAEQDPPDWWRAAAVTTNRVLAAVNADPKEILSLSFSTQMVNAIPVDAQGEPLQPCISWLDGRAWEQAQQIMRRLGGPKVFAALVGVALTGKDLLPKYLWIKRHLPEVYTRAAAIVDCSSFMLALATGRLVYEWSTASVTGLFNMKTKAWDNGLMRFFGLERSKFPELVPSHERVGGLTPLAAADFGLLEGTHVFGGAGDAMTAAIGSGAVAEGGGHVCLGTSGFVGVITARRIVGKRGIVTLQSADPGKLLLISETETAGACLKWAARELYSADGGRGMAETLARMDQEVAETPPGSGGLIFTPWMYGERSPIADESLRAAFLNLGSNHTRQQMTRSIYEGVAYNLRWMLDSISELYGFQPNPLRVVGGGAKGLPWLQIIADVTGRSLEVAGHPQEATALGAGLIAAVGLGIYPTIEATARVVPFTCCVTPNPESRATYEQLYTAFRQLYPALRGIYHQLNKDK